MKITRRTLGLTFCGAVIRAQSSDLPDTPAGRRLRDWLGLINKGDANAIRTYFAANYPAAPNKGENAIQLSQMTGGFKLIKVLDSKPATIEALVKAQNAERYAKLTLSVDPDEPHPIKSVQLGPGQRPAELAPTRLDEASLMTALQQEAERNAAADQFSGAVLLARRGKPLFARAYGFSDRERKTPNQLNSKFRLGSMNKMFTAVSIMQLVQKRVVQTDDVVGKFLTDYPNKDVATKVTIHHLLTHTGGTGDFFGPQFDENRLKLKGLKDYVGLYGTRGLKFEPGSRFDYSNYGFLLLGLIVEKASGQDYYEYVREHVFKPAGMTRTDSLPESEGVPDRAIGYMRGPGSGAWTPNTDTLPVRGTSAGGGYSTVGDLVRFADALTGHKLLDEQHTRMLTTGKVAQGSPDEKYAYGFFEAKHDGLHWFGHGGGAPGMNGELKIMPDQGYALAVLANLDPPAASNLAEFALDRIPISVTGQGSKLKG